MEISFSELLQAGFGVIALAILYVYMQSTSKDNERRDNADKFEREQRAKDNQQFMLLFATLSGKHDASTASILKSSVDSEARVNTQITASEVALKGRVQTVGDANIARLDKIDKALTLIQTTVNLFTDPSADAKYDKALEILTAKLEVMAADIKDIATDVATNAEVGTANTGAITAAADALAATHTSETPAATVPAEVVVTAVTPEAVADILKAMPGNGDTEERKAS